MTIFVLEASYFNELSKSRQHETNEDMMGIYAARQQLQYHTHVHQREKKRERRKTHRKMRESERRRGFSPCWPGCLRTFSSIKSCSRCTAIRWPRFAASIRPESFASAISGSEAKPPAKGVSDGVSEGKRPCWMRVRDCNTGSVRG